MSRIAFQWLVPVVLLTIPGCTRMPGGIAPSNIPLAPDGYTRLREVKRSDCKVNLLGLIPVSGSNYTADAMDEALEEVAGAEALIDITVERVSKFFILWSQTCTEVRATAVSVP
ncbi:MAG: hypothetical protein IPK00_18500 [Deltaproteobacteria bacterium]|nr:hypothetical protein [Deltaproteobacteria bacterium]